MFMVTSASSCCWSLVPSREEEEEEEGEEEEGEGAEALPGAGMKAWPHGLKGNVAPWRREKGSTFPKIH